mgnify:CR=1 FL=1
MTDVRPIRKSADATIEYYLPAVVISNVYAYTIIYDNTFDLWPDIPPNSALCDIYTYIYR